MVRAQGAKTAQGRGKDIATALPRVEEYMMKSALVVALAALPLLLPVRAFAQAPSPAFISCLDQDDGTKERLNCFDKLVPPQVRQVLVQEAPKNVTDCRYVKEEDQRLKCFNHFVVPSAPKPAAGKRTLKLQ
jgi:hypothetical protein